MKSAVGAAIATQALAGTSLKVLKHLRNCSTGKGIFLQAEANFYTFRNSVTRLESIKPFYS